MKCLHLTLDLVGGEKQVGPDATWSKRICRDCDLAVYFDVVDGVEIPKPVPANAVIANANRDMKGP